MVISVAIQKGGSGKTTTVINLAAAFRNLGKKVLLLDLDPQSNLTQSLGIKEPEMHIYELFRQEGFGDTAIVEDAIVHHSGMDVIPATLDLAHSELELVSVYGRETILKNMLQQVQDRYDFIFIDCPPAIGMLTVNALVASNYILLPLQAEYLPLRGLHSFMKFYKSIHKLNPTLQILGILITIFDTRIKMSENIAGQIAENEEFGGKLLDTRIRINNALAQAQEQGVDIFTYDSLSRGAQNYMDLAYEIQNRLEANGRL